MGMATYQVTGPGGAIYHVQGPEGADPSEILAAMHGQSGAAVPSPAPSGGFLTDAALAGRDAAEGVLDTFAAPHDLGIALQNKVAQLSNKYLGTHIAPQHTFSGQLSRALTYLGAPVPTTPDQQLAASAIRGTTGALTGAGALGIGGFANAVRAALAGASGGASSNIARQAGAGPVGQFIAGTVGGLAPSAIEGALPALNPFPSRNPLIRPFTGAGQAQMAANTLVREATDPAAAAMNLSQAEPLVPGSMRTTGEASGDTGLLALEKGIRARSPGPFGERISQQNAARQAELAALGKTPADIAAAEALRESETAPMREAAFAGARGRRMTLYRGIRPGASDGYMNGGALWTTPDRNVAAQYAADQLGPNDFASAGARATPGNVQEYHVSLQRPYVLTQDNLPDFAKFFAPGEAESGGYIDNDGSMGDRPGLIGLSHTARQNLLDNGYDSVIVHAEAVRPEGEPPSVILLRSPEDTATASAADTAPTLGKRNYAASDPTEDSILQYLAKHPRGLDSTEAAAQGLDPSQFNAPESMVGIKRAFRRGGMSFDQAAETLHQAGYPVADAQGNYDPNALLDAIDGELRGSPVYSMANTRRLAELEQAAAEPQNLNEFLGSRPASATAPPAPTITSPVHDTINRILDSPAGARESIGKTMRWAQNLIGEHTDPEALYEVRKDLALAQRDQLQPGGRDAPNATMLAQARGQLGKVIGSLDDAIESAAPGYKAYLRRYAELSEPIDQMHAIQNLQQRASSGLDTATGEQFLSGPQFARNLRTTLERADGPFSPRLTPEQTQRLEAVREDLQRAGAVGNPTVRAPGSDTFQNFMTGQRTGSAVLPHFPFVGKFLSPLSKYIDSRVNDQLTDAMLNPRRAAQLLRQGVPQTPIRAAVAASIGRRALPATLGPMLATPSPTASTGLIASPSPITALLERGLSPLTGLSPRVAPSNPLQALWMTVDPAAWAKAVHAGHTSPTLAARFPERQHGHISRQVHAALAHTRTGAIPTGTGALIAKTGPGRHVTILPPTFPGGTPQHIAGIAAMPR